MSEIVDVVVSPKSLPPPPKTQYAILCDRSITYIVEWADAHPKCFVFSFYTKRVADVPDWNKAPSSNYIFQPWYVGNFKEPANGIRQIMLGVIEALAEPYFNISPPWEVECVLDESK